ncbi:MAG TPA: AzlC family ABC transporter permease [Stellaceae bacterium]|nr:AzlC family ABC transporter permease [Stellaceae bacterium]
MTVLSEKSGGARAAFTAGALRCAPVALGVLAYGLVFGALAQQAGLSFAETAFMSAIVYSGSAQFVALGLWTLPPPVLALAVATLLVNFRFFLIAATMGRVLKGWPLLRVLAALPWVTDENWAVTMAEGERRHWGAFFLGTGAVLYVTWPTASLLGHALGAVVADPKAWGFDFAFTAVFMTLAVGLARKHRAPLVWLASAAGAFLADRVLAGGPLGASVPVLVGGLAGALAAALRSGDSDAR